MSLRNLRILVTGGAGFIGSHIVESLVRAGARVAVYDNFSSGLRENLERVREDVEWIEGDILDLDTLRRAARERDVISHQAAQLEITRCLDDPIEDLKTNTIGTLHVFLAAREAGVGRIVNASSACVYGQAATVPQTEDGHPTDPNWAYGASKLVAEKYGKIWTRSFGLPVSSLRYAIVYGEREWYGRALTIFLKRLLEGKPPVVFGDGGQVRDFVYVGDVVRLHDLALESDGVGGEVFNVSTGVATTIGRLAELACEVSGVGLLPVHEQVPVGGRSAQVDGRMRLPSELQVMCLDPSKAGRRLGWKPEVPLREGLAREWTWLKEHPARWTRMSY